MSEMKIVTYNLRNQWHRDGENGFIHRVGLMYHVIEREQPDVIAFQEVMPRQLEVLEKIFPDYMFVGQGRDADLQGEALYTAIKKSTCQFCGMDIFWLSPQPYVPATRFETQSECPRICVDVLVRHKESGKMVRVYNVHLDHIESVAKEQGMEVVLAKMAEDQDKLACEAVLLGDFNEEPKGPAVTYCNEYDKLKIIDLTTEITGTFHDYGKREFCKIDYIFVTEGLAANVAKVEAWTTEHSGIYLSDHYPIAATFNL